MTDDQQASSPDETPRYFVAYGPQLEVIAPCWMVTSTRAISSLKQEITAAPSENLVERFLNGPPYPSELTTEGVEREVRELLFPPGYYHSRIYRQNHGGPSYWIPRSQSDQEFIARARDHLSAILGQLSEIFRVIEPGGSNANVYGPAIMNLLIVCCTEVEAQWKSVLRANEYEGSSTKDYFKTCDVLKLKEYSVRLAPYPWLDPVRPFADWVKDNPTKSLLWYQAYNEVKHDRYKNYDKATLSHCISAVSAIAILLEAQFDPRVFTYDHERMLSMESRPRFAPEDMYYPDLQTGQWTPAKFAF
ncbi:hypothetical protein [Rhizobium hainanense]|uniref:Uncharacterized protein n=1 Tax=Rhizobium hainanense TaxID=52131 RepID=A0A1C3UM78_9HYPH|nr:hypothetical protein [Rhizobium hainanense]SCB16583.1 hypothetical protein GA0061100_102639 [Rhizobium hainanense]